MNMVLALSYPILCREGYQPNFDVYFKDFAADELGEDLRFGLYGLAADPAACAAQGPATHRPGHRPASAGPEQGRPNLIWPAASLWGRSSHGGPEPTHPNHRPPSRPVRSVVVRCGPVRCGPVRSYVPIHGAVKRQARAKSHASGLGILMSVSCQSAPRGGPGGAGGKGARGAPRWGSSPSATRRSAVGGASSPGRQPAKRGAAGRRVARSGAGAVLAVLAARPRPLHPTRPTPLSVISVALTCPSPPRLAPLNNTQNGVVPLLCGVLTGSGWAAWGAVRLMEVFALLASIWRLCCRRSNVATFRSNYWSGCHDWRGYCAVPSPGSAKCHHGH